MLTILFMHALYGCTFTISKLLVNSAPPIFVIGLRMVLAGIILGLWVAYNKKTPKPEPFDKIAWFYLAQIAVFGIYFPYVLRYCAIQHLPVIKTALLYNIAPFGSFFFSYLFFTPSVTIKKWLGLIIGCSSILPLLLLHTRSGSAAEISSLWPEIAMVVAVLSFSYSWVVMKRMVLHTNCSPARINSITMFSGGILALATSPCFEPTIHIANPLQFFFWLGMIILITNVICYNLYAVLLRHHSPTLLSLAGLIAPVSAATTSWFFLGEKITPDCYLSGVLVLIGFAIFYYEELKESSQQSQEEQSEVLNANEEL